MKKPRSRGHHKTIDYAKKILKDDDEDEWISRQELAKKIDEETTEVSEASAAANLSTFRTYLEKNNFKTKERIDNGGGNPTVYWSVQK